MSSEKSISRRVRGHPVVGVVRRWSRLQRYSDRSWSLIASAAFAKLSAISESSKAVEDRDHERSVAACVAFIVQNTIDARHGNAAEANGASNVVKTNEAWVVAEAGEAANKNDQVERNASIPCPTAYMIPWTSWRWFCVGNVSTCSCKSQSFDYRGECFLWNHMAGLSLFDMIYHFDAKNNIASVIFKVNKLLDIAQRVQILVSCDKAAQQRSSERVHHCSRCVGGSLFPF